MNNVINLCGRKGSCCPTAELFDETEMVVIVDDDGDSITLSWKNVEILYKEIQGEKAKKGCCQCKSCQRGSAC